MAGTVFIEGEYVAPEDARMSIFDMGFVQGDCVYDVVSTWAGWFFKLEEHLTRFERSCEGFRLKNPYGRDEVRSILGECVSRAGLENSYVKLQITRGVIPDHGRDSRLAENQFVAYAVPYIWIWGEEKCRNGANIYIAGTERVPSQAIDARFKNYNRADMVKARFEAYDRGCDDAVLLAADGSVTEGHGWNVLAVRDGRVVTPDKDCLEGVTRQAIAELCELEGVPFEFATLLPADLEGADELFAATTAGGVMPITALNQEPIGDGSPGELTRRLQSLYWQKREEGWHGTPIADVALAGTA